MIDYLSKESLLILEGIEHEQSYMTNKKQTSSSRGRIGR